MSSRIVVSGPPVDQSEEILTPAALEFLAELHDRFAARRDELLDLRQLRRDAVAVGEPMDFLAETAEIRAGDWTVAPIPAYLADRRVEITGPTDRKMTINALNSGAKIWLADLEDANTPAWSNVISGQVNLRDAIRRTIELDQDGKSYRLNDGELAVIVTRPRGWHLPEKHLTIDGAPLVGALVDFGLYFFHNAAELLARGAGPAFYLPKMESHLEARLWAEVFAYRRVGTRDRAGHHPGDRADRDHLGRIRDGRDPLRAAGLRGRAERRPVGLPVLDRQDLPRRRRRLRAARPERHHHGRAVHEGLLRPARRDLPPPRRLRDRRHGGLHPVPAGRGDQRGRLRQGAGRQDPGGRRRIRGFVGGAPGPGADLPGDLRRRTGRGVEPARQVRCRQWMSAPRTSSTSVRCR